MSDTEAEPVTSLSFRAGELRVRGWPSSLAVPFGLRREGGELRGPARLRWRAIEALWRAEARFDDEVAAPLLADVPPLTATSIANELLGLIEGARWRGIVVGMAMVDRVVLVHALLAGRHRRVIVVVLDTGAEHAWRAACVVSAIDHLVDVLTVARAAHAASWLGGRYDSLVVDDGELMPSHQLEPVLDAAAATVRIGFLARPDRKTIEQLSGRLGPLIAVIESHAAPRYCELRVNLPVDRKAAYAQAWHRFFAAFDRFAATRADVGFGAFVQQARDDPRQRPALLAWHDAVRIASWHEQKAEVTAVLLRRHRDQRVLVFTPDRRVAYALAREHLIGAITAELALAERHDLLTAFVDGQLRVLAGPRLLDVGVPEGIADVGILVGGGYGRSQREARRRRVRASGILYELVSCDTLEVGRAHRWRGTPAGARARH